MDDVIRAETGPEQDGQAAAATDADVDVGGDGDGDVGGGRRPAAASAGGGRGEEEDVGILRDSSARLRFSRKLSGTKPQPRQGV